MPPDDLLVFLIIIERIIDINAARPTGNSVQIIFWFT